MYLLCICKELNVVTIFLSTMDDNEAIISNDAAVQSRMGVRDRIVFSFEFGLAILLA